MSEPHNDITSSSSSAAAAATTYAEGAAAAEGRDSSNVEMSEELLTSQSRTQKRLSDLPLEMLETVLMRAFLMFFSSDFDGDDDSRQIRKSGKSSFSERRAFTLLSSVCWYWRYTLTGWPQSPTGQWVKHQLKKLIEGSCRPFQRSAAMQHLYELDNVVWGVTQLHDVVYIVCWLSSRILRFNATTHQRLTDIEVDDLEDPQDIAACEQTSRVYVADSGSDDECIWRVSADGADLQRWLPRPASNKLKPLTLSVTSSRLLVTSRDTNQLMQFDAGGDELRRVRLPDDMKPCHGVESPTGTFIVSHVSTQLTQQQGHVSEVNTGGQVLRQFSGSRLPSLGFPPHIAVDSHGNILAADYDNRRILLLNSQLQLRRVIIDEHQLNQVLWRLSYTEQSGQLLVVLKNSVAVFRVLRR